MRDSNAQVSMTNIMTHIKMMKLYTTPVVHLAQNHLVQKRPLSAKLFRAKFNHPKVQLAQNSVL